MSIKAFSLTLIILYRFYYTRSIIGNLVEAPLGTAAWICWTPPLCGPIAPHVATRMFRQNHRQLCLGVIFTHDCLYHHVNADLVEDVATPRR